MIHLGSAQHTLPAPIAPGLWSLHALSLAVADQSVPRFDYKLVQSSQMSMCWLLGPRTGTSPALAKQIIVDWQAGRNSFVTSAAVVLSNVSFTSSLRSTALMSLTDGMAKPRRNEAWSPAPTTTEAVVQFYRRFCIVAIETQVS